MKKVPRLVLIFIPFSDCITVPTKFELFLKNIIIYDTLKLSSQILVNHYMGVRVLEIDG